MEAIKFEFSKVRRVTDEIFESDTGVVKVITVHLVLEDEDGTERVNVGDLRNAEIWVEDGPGWNDGANRFGGYRFKLNESALEELLGSELYAKLSENCDLSTWEDMGDTAAEARKYCEREWRELLDRARKLDTSGPEPEGEGLEECGECGGYLVECEA